MNLKRKIKDMLKTWVNEKISELFSGGFYIDVFYQQIIRLMSPETRRLEDKEDQNDFYTMITLT